MAIRQGFHGKYLLWRVHSWLHSQAGAILPALVQHDMIGQRGDVSTVKVWRDLAVCGTGQVDYIHPHLGRVAYSQGGREEEFRNWQWSQSRTVTDEFEGVK